MIGRIIFASVSICLLINCAFSQSVLNVDSNFAGRKLLEAKNSTNTTTIVNIANCSLIYVRDMVITDKDGSYNIMVPELQASSKSTCENGSGLIDLELAEASSQLKSFKLSLNFTKTRGYWQVKALLTFDCSAGINCTKDTDIPMNVQSWRAPLKMSYHCSKSPIGTARHYNGTRKPILKINKIQLQVFEFSQGGRFDLAADCTPYFTIPTLSVLFVSIILLLIISYGIGMISNIKTMDRFDDPKGKHLQIASSTD